MCPRRRYHYADWLVSCFFEALSQEFVENAVRILVTRFIPLNTSDLDNWMADPEEWVNVEDKENDQWEYEIRVRILSYDSERQTDSHKACSERVLMQLCNQFPVYVVPLLATTFEQVAGESVDLRSILRSQY